ncbi:MAG: hypothetical protein ACR2RV_13865 [Verrucomicrobiales bacterium]
MKTFSIPAFLLGLITVSLVAYYLAPGGRSPEIVEDHQEPPRPLPSALVRSDRGAAALFQSQLKNAQIFYRTYKQATETATRLTPSRLSSIVDDETDERTRASLIQIWAHSDPSSALEHLLRRLPEDSSQLEVMGPAIEIWAKQDPGAAIAWFDQFAAMGSREQVSALQYALIRGVEKSDPHRALALIHERSLRSSHSRITFENTEDWVQILDRDSQSDFLLSNWFTNDPEACEAWALAQNAERRTEALSTKFGDSLIRYCDAPLAKAIDLWPTLSGSKRSEAGSKIVNGLSAREPDLAAEWLNRFQHDPDLDLARARFAGKLAYDEPEAAFEWAGSIFDEVLRADSEQEVFRRWSRFDPDGAEEFFLAQGWDREAIAELQKK